MFWQSSLKGTNLCTGLVSMWGAVQQPDVLTEALRKNQSGQCAARSWIPWILAAACQQESDGQACTHITVMLSTDHFGTTTLPCTHLYRAWS